MRLIILSFFFGVFFVGFGECGVVRIGAANLLLEGSQDLNGLLKKVEAVVAEARAKNVSYLLLPELISFDLLATEPKDIASALKENAKMFPALSAGIAAIAKKYSISILGASALVVGEKGPVNRSLIVGPDGGLRSQDKIYPTPWERRFGVLGGGGVNLFQSEHFSFVILICHDAEFPSLSAQLSKLAPEVIFVPSQTDDLWGLERVRRTSAARAIEHMAYVVMTGASGSPQAKWHSYVGKNFLFTPKNPHFEGIEDRSGSKTDGTELSVFEVDLAVLRKARADRKQIYPGREEASFIGR